MREIFDEDAELYDRARPGYPEKMFVDLAGAGVPPGAHILEIACGTGQATKSLAARGYRIDAVELGPSMAAVARRNLNRFPHVTVHTAEFERWPLPADPFDVVFCATAFHWLDPAVRMVKSADALRPGGILATVATHHVAGGSSAFFVEVQNCYERFDPDTPPGLRPSAAADIATDPIDAVASDRFAAPTFHRYEWEQAYSTATYLDLLMTYSGMRALPVDARTGLLTCIGSLIDRRGGRIIKRYLTELRLARRRD